MTPLRDVIRSCVAKYANLLVSARKRWGAYDVYLSALLIFATSRLIVFIGVNFGKLLSHKADPWGASYAWYYRLLSWDSGWYADIIRHGYQYSRDTSIQSSVVFYPLYPLISYWVKSLFGVDEYLALLLVANVASLGVVLLMTKFVKDELGDEIAFLSLAFFWFFPSSLFLSAGYTESLCLVFILLSFMLLTRQNFVLAAISAGLSLGTRSTGIVMIPVILWEMWQRNTLPWPRLLPRMALCGFLAASGLLLFMIYLEIKFGHPLAFATGHAAWHRRTFLDRLSSALTLAAIHHGNWRDAAGFLSFLALTFWSFWRLRFALSLFSLGVLMLPYFTVGITSSMNRYALMCFPAFMCLGILCKGRIWLASVLVGIFAALLLRNTALFSYSHIQYD